MNILADKSLPKLAYFFPKPFALHYYSSEEDLRAHLPEADVLLCRANLQVTGTLLQNTSLQAVATASSGIDHIDTRYLEQRGIKLFSAHGSNAQAVADYVTSCLAYLKQAGKLQGYKAGVIGVGKVGLQVVKRLKALNFKTVQYDPFKALEKNHTIYCHKEALFGCDLLCIHANLHDLMPYASRNLLNEQFLANLQPDTVIINAARGGIVREDELLNVKKPLTYCTDVYLNEPDINKAIVDFAAICTPHIAGHSIEAKVAAVAQTSQAIHGFFGLNPVSLPKESAHLSLPEVRSCWEQLILNIYNPLEETMTLKASPKLKETFLNLRAAHNSRHQFSSYDIKQPSPKLKALLGL